MKKKLNFEDIIGREVVFNHRGKSKKISKVEITEDSILIILEDKK